MSEPFKRWIWPKPGRVIAWICFGVVVSAAIIVWGVGVGDTLILVVGIVWFVDSGIEAVIYMPRALRATHSATPEPHRH
jgi:hypothetical protein